MLMFVAFEIAVAKANAIPRLAFGRGMVDETQDRMTWKAENEPIA